MPHYRSQLVYTGVAGSPWYMTLKGNQTDSSPSEWADELDALAQALAAGTANDCTISFNGVIDLLDDSTEALMSEFSEPSFGYVGANASDMLPQATQLLLKMQTTGIVTGPTGRTTRVVGKTYIPGLCVNQANNGYFALSVVNQFLTAFRAAEEAVGLVIYSPTGQATFGVTGITGDQKPAVLRSRRD